MDFRTCVQHYVMNIKLHICDNYVKNQPKKNKLSSKNF